MFRCNVNKNKLKISQIKQKLSITRTPTCHHTVYWENKDYINTVSAAASTHTFVMILDFQSVFSDVAEFSFGIAVARRRVFSLEQPDHKNWGARREEEDCSNVTFRIVCNDPQISMLPFLAAIKDLATVKFGSAGY